MKAFRRILGLILSLALLLALAPAALAVTVPKGAKQLYQSVLDALELNGSVFNNIGRGYLGDLDGDGEAELLVAYVTRKSYDSPDVTVFSLYDAENGALVTRARDVQIRMDAGGGSCGIMLGVYQGADAIITWRSNSDVSYGSVEETNIYRASDAAKLVSLRRVEEYDPASTTYFVNGTAVSKSAYDRESYYDLDAAWLTKAELQRALSNSTEASDERILVYLMLDEPTNKTCTVGDAWPDLIGGRYRVTYDDLTSETIPLTRDMVLSFDSSVPGWTSVELWSPEGSWWYDVLVQFQDVTNEYMYYYDPVYWALANGITTGVDAAHFSPYSTVTRGQAVTFLWRAAGCPRPRSSKNPFTDVRSGDYFYDAVLWAVEQGITNGTDASHFSPNQTCTQAHIITFLWRLAGRPGSTGTGTWYYDAVTWANRQNLLKDMLGTFLPENDCPRSDVVTYLYRAAQNGLL